MSQPEKTEQRSACCPYCGSPKIGYTDVNEMECTMANCGQTVNLLELEAVQEKFFDSLKFCPRSACKSPKIKLRNEGELECEVCHEPITIPLYAQTKVVEALKLLRGKGRPKLKKEKVEIEERPEGPDFHWFVRDLAKPVRRFPFIMSFETAAREKGASLQDWVKSLRSSIDIEQLKRDWGRCLRGGEAVIPEVSSVQHCWDKLLLPLRKKPLRMTQEDARSFSDALKEEYPKEIERYRKAGRTAIEIEVEEAVCCVSPTLAAQYLGYKNTSSIRRLRKQKELRRCETHPTRITKASLITLKRKRDSRK